MAFSCATGLVVIAEMMEDELTTRRRAKGKHDPDRVAEERQRPRLGRLGGRTVPVAVPGR